MVVYPLLHSLPGHQWLSCKQESLRQVVRVSGTQVVKAELTTPGSLEHFMQALHEVFQHTPILSSTCRCTLLLWGRWLTAGCHVHAAHKFWLTTSRSRLVTLFIENSFAAGVCQLWVNLVLFYLLKEWKPTLIDTGVHNPAHKVSRFCFKVFDTVHKLLSQCQPHQQL